MTAELERLSFSIAEVAIATGLSRATLYRRIESGELNTIKVGGRALVTRAELEHFLNGKGGTKDIP